MSRREFDLRLQVVLDERRSPAADPVLRELARDDTTLQAELAAHEAWSAVVARWEAPRPATDFTARVMARVSAERATSAKSAWTTQLKYAAAIAAAVAAAVLVAVSLNGWRPNGAPRNDAPSLATSQPTPQPPLRYLAQQAKDRYIGLAQETRQSVDGALAAIPHLPLATKRTVEEPAADEPTTVSVADVVEGIKPLRESTAGTVSSLLMAFPLGDNKRS